MDYKAIKSHFEQADDVLKTFLSEDENFKNIEKAGLLIVDAILNRNKIISCGNGGSMCDAMHFAEELSGRYRNERKALPAIAISDSSHITCTANDYGFDHIFSRFIDALGNKNDVLFAISTSGNSLNILNAIKAAKEKGMKIIGLTGKDGGIMKTLCDVEIRVSHDGFSDRIQEIHIKIIHSLIDFIETRMGLN
ncbi:phosphoheptose isomerase [Pedobacter psychrophilus]|uniref:Phosphoheptose isomerase n=1 Tax=Pedobacter psychrophilus TaxID=1826909 RepID=A0A179DC80_9SPHI|nr:D-sedoheptulose 7-phosphate isomerase [Pedobacter psychrophilus]OAQ38392.1 phosphoheptose isomerase [Pedobacter psychrophilus]